VVAHQGIILAGWGGILLLFESSVINVHLQKGIDACKSAYQFTGTDDPA